MGLCKVKFNQGHIPTTVTNTGVRVPWISDRDSQMWSELLDVAQSHTETLSQQHGARFVNEAQQSGCVAMGAKDLKSLPVNQMLPKKRHSKKLWYFSTWPKAMIVFVTSCYWNSLIIYSNVGSNLYLTALQRATVTFTTVLVDVALINPRSNYFPVLMGGGALRNLGRCHVHHLHSFRINFKVNTFWYFFYQLLKFTKCNWKGFEQMPGCLSA